MQMTPKIRCRLLYPWGLLLMGVPADNAPPSGLEMTVKQSEMQQVTCATHRQVLRERIGGDIFEMSCTGIISIPLVLAWMRAATVSKHNGQGPGWLARRRVSNSFHHKGTFSGYTLVVRRVIVISLVYFKLKSGNKQRQWLCQVQGRRLAFHRCLLLGKVPCKNCHVFDYFHFNGNSKCWMNPLPPPPTPWRRKKRKNIIRSFCQRWLSFQKVCSEDTFKGSMTTDSCRFAPLHMPAIQRENVVTLPALQTEK